MPRRSADATRTSIREAAAELFLERGYARTTVRRIAEQAGSDPALVIRHFGTKEALFLETMRLTIDDEPLLDVPLEALGVRFVEYLLEHAETTREVFLALVQGSGEPSIGARLRRSHEEMFIAPLRSRLHGGDADLRARLAAALVGGLLYALWVVGDEALLAADHTELAERYGALLQPLLTPAG